MTSIEQRDVQSVLDGVDDLLPLIAKRAQAAEDLRRIPDETIAELDQAGFFKLLQPEQWGGLQCDPTAFYEAVRRLGSACGSTGWVSSIIGVHNWHLALFDQQAQEEVWGGDSSVRISSSYAPMGRAPSSTAVTSSAVPGSGPRGVTTPRGPSSVDR